MKMIMQLLSMAFQKRTLAACCGYALTLCGVLMLFMALTAANGAEDTLLYRHAANRMTLNLPEGLPAGEMRYELCGGQVLQDGEPGELLLIPGGRGLCGSDCALQVYHGENLVHVQWFGVREVPSPSLAVKDEAGQVVPTGATLSLRKADMLGVSLMPEERFAQMLPQDAAYRANGYQASLWRGGQLVGQMECAFERCGLGGLLAKAKTGDKLELTVHKAVRYNGLRQEIPVPPTPGFSWTTLLVD